MAETAVKAAEFSRRIGIDSHVVYRAIKRGDVFAESLFIDPETRQPWIYPEAGAREWAANYNPYKSGNLAKPKPVQEGPRKGGRPKSAPHVPPQMPAVDPNGMAELKRKQAALKLQTEAITLRKLQGGLLDKKQVFAAQFEAAKQIRLGFESVPDRTIDAILAAGNRTAAHAVLAAEINAQLERVAETLASIIGADENP